MKPGLVIIDVQHEYFAPEGRWPLPDAPKALARIQELLGAAREAGIPVFHVTHEGLDPNAPVFRAGSPGARMHEAISILPGEQHITKHFPGSFTQTPLEAYLRRAGIDTLIVCGFMTHLCCDTTTRQASERGLSVLFTSDATATRDLALRGETVPHQRVHETTLAVMTNFATVLTTEEIRERVGAAARVP